MDNEYIYSVAKEKGFDVSRLPGDPATCWVMKALDPASEKCGPLTGIPDLNNEATLVMEWRQVDQLSPPAGLAATDTWDGEIVTFPGPALLAVVRTKKTTDTAWTYSLIMNKQYTWGSTQPTTSASGITGGDPGRWPSDVVGSRVMYASTTGVFNGADLSNQGTIIGGQIPSGYVFREYSNVAGQAAGTGSPYPVTGLSTPTIWEQGIVYSGAPGYDSIMQVCPRAEMTRAKEGWYIPARLTNVSANTPFQDSNSMVAIMVSPWLDFTTLETLPGWFPIPEPGNAQFGVVAFRGIAPTSTYTITSRLGYECTIQTSTAFRAFVTTSCPPDFALVQEYARINAQLADCYVSKYNSYDVLGKIITQLAQHMPSPWNTIVPLIAKVGGGIAGAAGLGKPKGSKMSGPSKGKFIGPLKEDGTTGAERPSNPGKKVGPRKGKSRGIPGMPKPARNARTRRG